MTVGGLEDERCDFAALRVLREVSLFAVTGLGRWGGRRRGTSEGGMKVLIRVLRLLGADGSGGASMARRALRGRRAEEVVLRAGGGGSLAQSISCRIVVGALDSTPAWYGRSVRAPSMAR